MGRSYVTDKDQGLNRVVKALRKMDAGRISVKVGLPAEKADSELAHIGAIHEFGATWRMSDKQIFYFVRRVMGVDPLTEPARFFGAIKRLKNDPMMTIPERSWLRGSFDQNQGRWANRMRQAVASAALGDGNLKRYLDAFGAGVSADVRRYIAGGIPPANSPVTIRAKGSSGTLRDTGYMTNSITWVVKGF